MPGERGLRQETIPLTPPGSLPAEQELVPRQAPRQRAGGAAGGGRTAGARGPLCGPQAQPHAVSRGEETGTGAGSAGPGQPCPARLPAGRRWFHGKISGQEAVQQLQPPEDGLFLVRESARHPGDYVLCVSFGRDVIHYRVLHRDGHLTIDEAVCFCNLMDMVEVRPATGPGPQSPCPPIAEMEGCQAPPYPYGWLDMGPQRCLLPNGEKEGLVSMV